MNTRFLIAALFIITSSIGCVLSVQSGGHFISYFTNLSNYTCLIVMLVELVRLALKKPLTTAMSIIEFCATMSIIITCLVYNTLLGDIFSSEYWQNTQSIIMHLINPILFVFYYFKYKMGARLHAHSFIWCLLMPYTYIIYIFIRHNVVNDQWFPYFFLNPVKIGLDGVAMWIIILTAIFTGLGYLTARLSQGKS